MRPLFLSVIVCLVCLLLASCSSGSTPPAPTGQVFAFNPGEWTPTPADLVLPQ